MPKEHMIGAPAAEAISSKDSFEISGEFARSFNDATTRDIAKHMILHGRPHEAWRLLEATSLLGDLWLVLDNIRDRMDDTRAYAELAEPLAPSMLDSLRRQAAGDGAGVDRCGHWLCKEPALLPALVRADAGNELPAIFVATDFEYSLSSRESHAWRDFLPAMQSIPGLWEACIGACVESWAKEPDEGRVGSPGLLLAAADAGPAAFSRCLAKLAELGLDPAACVAQSWPDANQTRLAEHLRENNALTDALAGGQADTVALIVQANPKMDPMAEALRVRQICDGLSKGAQQATKDSMQSIAEGALAIAEAFELAAEIKERRAPNASKAAKNL